MAVTLTMAVFWFVGWYEFTSVSEARTATFIRAMSEAVRGETVEIKGSMSDKVGLIVDSEIMKEDELVFLKAHIVELPATALRQFKA
jgi:hypothetical protein